MTPATSPRVTPLPSDAVVGLPDDVQYRIDRESDEMYVRGLGRLLLAAAVAYPLLGLGELAGQLSGVGDRPIRQILLARFAFGAGLAVLALLIRRGALQPWLVQSIDVAVHVSSGVLLGWLGALATPEEAWLYIAGLGVAVFARCLYVPGHAVLAAILAIVVWLTTLAVYLGLVSQHVQQGMALFWPRFLGLQVVVGAYLGLAIYGAFFVSRLHRREIEGRSRGRYHVQECIGEGGFGAVYRAWDTYLDRWCAIKTIRRDGLLGDEAKQQFEVEARATSQLKSPHTVRIYDFGCTRDDRLYYVMEFLDGRDLLTVLASDFAIEVRRVLGWMVQVTTALAEAHERGVIHRDLKPENLFLIDNDGEESIKVVDFGLALAPFGHDPGEEAANVVMGTPAYIAPERAVGGKGDARSDIYSLGAVLYELLTGSEVFPSSDMADVMRRQVEEVPQPPSTLRPDLPESIDVIVLRCLEKDPARRFKSMRELRQALLTAADAA